jgi:S-adenosylmethionine synthetase
MSRYAAEWVLPGHPDKLCDAIADSLVEQAAAREKRALCGVEVAIHRSTVVVTGRIACENHESIDAPATARGVLASAGYAKPWAPAPAKLRVISELCLGPLEDGEAGYRAFSDDQSIVTGYACETPDLNFLPVEQWLAWRVGCELEKLRVEQPDLRLGPDGKAVITYDERMRRATAFSASLQQAIGADEVDLFRAAQGSLRRVLEECARLVEGFDPVLPETMLVNGAGNFEVGGPEGDNGLSGKKLVVDAYGPRVPIGGGALSGKDFFKADRAGAILARRLAKAVVLSGAARECTSVLEIFPGDRDFRIVSLKTPGGELDSARWARLMDLSLEAAGEAYALTPNLAEVARHGHFTCASRPWETVRIGVP